MRPVRAWARLPGRMTALFFAVAAVSVCALGWLGVRLLEQDRALEAQRLQEQRESAAGRLAAELERVLSAEDRMLAGLPQRPGPAAGEGAVLVVANHTALRVWPERALLYYLAAPATKEPAADLYAAAEKAEFRERNHERAIEILHPLCSASDPSIRAGAQLRLARNLRKAGRPDAALEAYASLEKATAVGLSGVPADLVARRARCAVLENLHRSEQLRQEARGLYRDLNAGRWRLDRSSYLYYAAQAAHWLQVDPDRDSARRAMADAVAWLWQSWRSARIVEPGSSGRHCPGGPGSSVTVIWRASADRVAALAAGPAYQRSHWFGPAMKLLQDSGVRAAVLGRDGRALYGAAPPADVPQTRREASANGLPWTLAITNSGVEAQQFAERRRLLMAGLAALVLLVIAGSYLAARAVSSELAVAQLQSDFVSAVSHEFRTPLTSLRQFTEMLVEDDNLPAGKRRSFHLAQERATRRLSRLVESLLDFGRMEAGARPYRPEPMDAVKFAGEVVEEFRQEAARKCAIECRLPDGQAIVHADREALAQALWNLLDNAVKYSGDNPAVIVEVECLDEVAIRVRDSGIGIPPSERKLIFRKFARGSGAEARGIKGAGIGLAMVRHIVDAHGGTITVESEPGKGSVFTMLLPAKG